MHLLLALTVTVFAQNLEQPRTLAMLDDGTLLVSRPMLHDVLALRDRDGDGRADEIRTAVSLIEHANGLAMHGNTLYIAGASSIVSAERKPDGSFDAPQELVSGVAGAGAIGAGPDGKLYVSLPQRGTLLQFDPDGSNRRIFARGLHSLGAFAWDPKTNELWSADDGALHRIADGGRYDLAPAASAFAFHDAAAFSASRNGIVRFIDGKPASYLDGVSPSGITFARDGSLFFSDERQGIIYRVTDTPLPLPEAMTSAASESHTSILAKAFHVDGLTAPAAVVHDEEQDVYFVASRGAIVRVTPDGAVSDATFVQGLASPRGMALRGKELWIADGAKLRVVDRVTGASIRTINLAPRGAESLSAIAIGANDNVYVTDSGVRGNANGRIFRVAGDLIEVAFAGEELRAPNAIAWDGLRFLVAQGYGHDVLAWSPGGGPTAVMRGPGSYDGLVVLPNGAVIVSSEYDEAIHVGFGSGELHPLFTRAPSPAAIGFDRKRNRLLVPSPEGNWLEGWTLPPLEAPARPLLRRKNLETRRPPAREDRLHELRGQSLVAHLDREALMVVVDGHEVDR